jgi:hypothetical protein
MLNPGSIYRNRDESPRCFMEVEITKDAITAKRIPFNMAMALGEE